MTTATGAPDKSKQLFDLLLVLLTVILFYLAFPSGGYGSLAWIAIVPTIVAFKNTHGRYAFMLGVTAATFGWLCSIWWAIEGIAKISTSPVNLIIPLVFVFCVLSAIPYGLGAWLHCRFNWGTSVFGALKSATIFTLLANYIPHLLPGNLVHSLYLSPLQIQLADIGGAPLVFFVLHCINFLLAAAILSWRNSRITSIKCLTIATLIFITNMVYGHVKTTYITKEIKQHSLDIDIVMVQPNYSIALRDREAWLNNASALQNLISKALAQKAVDVIIIPEIPLPISYKNYVEDKTIFNKVIDDNQVLITAIQPVSNSLNDNQGYFNTMEFINNQQQTHQYQKQKLLPFGEYLPFENELPYLRKLFPNAANYKAGNNALLFPLTIDNTKINIVPLICYEAVFTELVGNSVALGGDILVNTVNDAWFDKTAGQDIHLALSLFRVIEYRMPLIRSTNSGISVIIDAQGNILPDSRIEPNIAGYSSSTIQVSHIESFYQQYPQFFKLLCVFMSICAVITGLIKPHE